ncbi:MAG TPA: membrane protein insertase YidC, partial [Balneolaceae bacterium]|nr:membrane protein insertase YidC [Balneolaceae bacterium]
MDRNTITGLVLIFLVMIAWGYFSMPSEEERAQMRQEQARKDSLAALQSDSANQQKAAASLDTLDTKADSVEAAQESEKIQQGEADEQIAAGSIFAEAGVDSISTVVIETPLYRTTFTNKGAGPLSFTLLEHETWDQQPIQMLTDTTRSAYTLGFLTTGNFNVETRNLLFKQLTPQKNIQVDEDGQAQLKYVLAVSPEKRIIYTYTFYGDKYDFDLN